MSAVANARRNLLSSTLAYDILSATFPLRLNGPRRSSVRWFLVFSFVSKLYVYYISYLTHKSSYSNVWLHVIASDSICIERTRYKIHSLVSIFAPWLFCFLLLLFIFFLCVACEWYFRALLFVQITITMPLLIDSFCIMHYIFSR